MNKALKNLIYFSILGCTFSSVLHAGTNLNIGITSDYVWRGNSQTKANLTETPDQVKHSPAISLGLEHEADNGFYIGAWTSSIRNPGDDIEIDIYGGYSDKTPNDKIGYDIGLITYQFPGIATDFTEVYANASFLNDMIEIGVASTIDADKRVVTTVFDPSLISDDTRSKEGDTYSHIKISSEIKAFSLSTTIGSTNAQDDYINTKTALGYNIPDNNGTLTLAYDVITGGNSTINGTILSLSWDKSFAF